MLNTATVSIGQSTQKKHFDQLLNNDRYLASGTNTVFVGGKTFKSATTFKSKSTFTATAIFNKTADFSVRPKLPGIKSRTATSGCFVDKTFVSGTTHYKKSVKRVTFPSGPWNMDVNASKIINPTYFGLTTATFRKFRVLSISVRHNDAKQEYSMHYAGYYICIYSASSLTSLWMNRNAGGGFDNTSFNTSGTFNRCLIDAEIEE